MKEKVLETKKLNKKYSNKLVIDDVNVKINKGDIYGLIGRNGAGKTTLMRLATSLAFPTQGEIYLFGEKVEANTNNKNRIGCMIENPAFYPNLSAKDNLKYYAMQRGIVDNTQIEKVLEVVNLQDTGKKCFRYFSLGMKQRLGIALAILNNPDFVILDEPINGLDPIGISEIRDTIKRLNEEENITVLISSHILSELYLVANKFGFIEKGKLIKELTKDELDEECNRCLVIRVNDVEKATTVIEKQLNTTNYKVIDKKEIRMYEYLDAAGKVNKTLFENDIIVNAIFDTSISLEDYFKGIIKEEEIDA